MANISLNAEALSDAALARYSRQLLLPEVDIAGQQALAAAQVLIVGMGGLGCPAALYLTAAGVGALTLADADVIDLSNLQRQVLYTEADIGTPKVSAAARRLAALNPEVRLHALQARLNGAALMASVAAATLVIDASDNFATRYAINRACVALGRPLVSAAGIRLEGQFAVFDTRQAASPCYACLYPELPGGDDDAPAERCSAAGVLGPLVGILGSLQALEAIKLIVGRGQASLGRVCLFDAARLEWQSITLPRDPACAVCSQRPSTTPTPTTTPTL